MFNLDNAITEWRRQMAAGGIKSPAVLDELESHVREDVERQVRAGANAASAFETAVKKIGPASALKGEFKKTTAAMVLEKLMIALAVLFVAFGMFLGTVTMLLCYSTFAERLMGFMALGFILLAVCGWTKMVPFLPVIQEKRQRWLAQAVCLAAGFGSATLYVQLVVVHFERGRDGLLPAMGFLTILPIALGFGAACGLEKAVEQASDRIRA